MVVDGVHFLRLLGLSSHALRQGLDLPRAACVLIVVALFSPNHRQRDTLVAHTLRHVALVQRALKQVSRSIISVWHGSTRFLLYVLRRGASRVSGAGTQASKHCGCNSPGVDPELLNRLARHRGACVGCLWPLAGHDAPQTQLLARTRVLLTTRASTAWPSRARAVRTASWRGGVLLPRWRSGTREPLASAHGAVNARHGKQNAAVSGAATACRRTTLPQLS